jgi:hypothetical protein
LTDVLGGLQSNFLKPMSLLLAALPKALAAHVEAVLSDQTVTVGALTASARALSVFARPRVPDVVETHFEEKKVFLERAA